MPLSLRAFILVVIATTVVARAQSATTQSTTRPVYECRHADSAITLDGDLSDPAWSKAAWTESFNDVPGSTPVPRTIATRCKMLYDDKFLYIAAELTDSDVRAAMTKRNSALFLENCFEVFIDPDRSGKNYWEIEINARNTIWDLQLSRPYSEGGKPVPDAHLERLSTAVKVQGTLNDASDKDRGWTCELAVPLSAHAGDVWRINFTRMHYVPGIKGPRMMSWSPLPKKDYHMPACFGEIHFK